MKRMKKPLLLTTAALLGTLFSTPALLPTATTAQAVQYKAQSAIPPILGLPTGARIHTKGLAEGKMQFVQATGTALLIDQQITLNSFGRTAVEQAMGKKLSSKSNNVKFRFEVRKQGSGFQYSLFDKGNNQLLLSGPVTVSVAANSATHQELEFKAPVVRMYVDIRKGSADAKQISGKATFGIGVVPVPGSLTFQKY